MYTRIDIINRFEKEMGKVYKSRVSYNNWIRELETTLKIVPIKEYNKNGALYYLYNTEQYERILESMITDQKFKNEIISTPQIKWFIKQKGIKSSVESMLCKFKQKHNIKPCSVVGNTYYYTKEDAKKIIEHLLKNAGKGSGYRNDLNEDRNEAYFEQMLITESVDEKQVLDMIQKVVKQRDDLAKKVEIYEKNERQFREIIDKLNDKIRELESQIIKEKSNSGFVKKIKDILGGNK